MKNLLVMDMRFEPMGESPESLYAIPLSGFPVRYENRHQRRSIEYQFTILFFVIKSERGYVPTSAVVRSVMLRDSGSGMEDVAEGWLPVDPEPIVDYFEIDFETMIEKLERELEQEGKQEDESGVQTIKPEPNLVQTIGDQVVRGSVNLHILDADIFLSGVFALIDEVQASSAND